jgi:hypothetical protein
MDEHLEFTLSQVFAFGLANLLGLACLGLMIFVMRKPSPTPRSKILIAVQVGLLAIALVGVASIDLGIYLWAKTGNVGALGAVLPVMFCGALIVFPVVVGGAYIQIGFRNDLHKGVNAFAEKHKRVD